MPDQVRTSGGATFARGCLNEHGQLSWPLMQAKMGAGRPGATINRRTVAESTLKAHPCDYVVPSSIAGIRRVADVYRTLLAIADDDGVFPSVDHFVERAGFPNSSDDRQVLVRSMALLVHEGLIVERKWSRHRVIRIVATGQFIRTAGLDETETV